MGIRTNIEIILQLGNNNQLDSGSLVGDVDQQTLVDTLDKGGTTIGELDAGEINVLILVGNNIRLLYAEADGDLDIYLAGTQATGAELTGSGGTYPTGFVGGETLTINVDGTTFTTTFLSTDQSLVQVAQRINATAALAGMREFVASAGDGTELFVGSLTSGSGSIVEILSGTSLAILGLPVTSIVGVDPVPNTSPIKLRRLADPDSSQIETLKAFGLWTLSTTSVYISNPSVTDSVRYKLVAAGDFVAVDC